MSRVSPWLAEIFVLFRPIWRLSWSWPHIATIPSVAAASSVLTTRHLGSLLAVALVPALVPALLPVLLDPLALTMANQRPSVLAPLKMRLLHRLGPSPLLKAR